MPSLRDIESIAKFANIIRGGSQVFCYSEGDFRRSSAAALILYLRNLPKTMGGIRDACSWVFEDCPQAKPNQAMLVLADQLYGLGGALCLQAKKVFLKT
jgi:predicted protein tyrosine phosphatase